MIDNSIENLQGGREGSIKRKGKRVYRPAQEWTPTVHRFLNSLRENDFFAAPIPYEITDEGEEVVCFLEGDVYNEELPQLQQSDETLLSVAKLIRQYHKASIPFLNELNGTELWMLQPREPYEIICHGDIAPYNMVMNGNTTTGIIDFDTIHPGPRIWDIAYAVYRWVPLMAPENPESFGTTEDQLRRLHLFLDAYEELNGSTDTVLYMVIERLRSIVAFMKKKAIEGDLKFQKDIAEGHHLGFLRDITYVTELIHTWFPSLEYSPDPK